MSIKEILSQNILPVEKYVPKSLEKPAIMQRLIEVRNEAYSNEIERALNETPKTIGFASVYKDLPSFEDFRHLNTIAGRKKYGKVIIVDPFSFYVPYHLDSLNYGIYFRVERIKKDFRRFAHFVYYALENGYLMFLKDEHPSRWTHLKALIGNPREFVVSLFIAYIAYIYFHALTHHIVEDISSYLELIGRRKYSPIRSVDEEKFAEWVAFKTLESYKVPEVLYQSKKAERLLSLFSFMLPQVEPEKLVDVTFAMPVLLYIHFERYRDALYYPEVTQAISSHFSIIWEVMKHLHFTLEIEPVRIPGEQDIFLRLYLTKF